MHVHRTPKPTTIPRSQAPVLRHICRDGCLDLFRDREIRYTVGSLLPRSGPPMSDETQFQLSPETGSARHARRPRVSPDDSRSGPVPPGRTRGSRRISPRKNWQRKNRGLALGLLNRLNPLPFESISMLCPTRELANQVAKEIRRLARSIQN